MHVVLLSRSTLFSQRGGDTIQILRTAEALKRLDAEVTIVLNGESLPTAKIDLIHFFNIGRPADALNYLSKTNCPWVVSTIDVQYDAFDNDHGFLKIFSPWAREYFKTIGRGFLGTDRFPPVMYLWLGHRRSALKVLERSKKLFTTTQSEILRLKEKWGEIPEAEVILPGVQDIFKQPNAAIERHGILCVGRIEGIKNQLELIRAVNTLSIPLQLIGAGSRHQNAYLMQCENEASDQVTFSPYQIPESLALAYASHQVLVVPSLFETFGLTAIEGLASGCAVVLSRAAESYEQLKDFVYPCEPREHSIRQAILEAMASGPKPGGSEFAKQLSWENAADQLYKAYKSITQ